MKQFAKVLVLTTLIAVGCLIAPKDVKAVVQLSDDKVTVTWDSSDAEKVTIGALEVTSFTTGNSLKLTIDQVKTALGGTLSSGDKPLPVTVYKTVEVEGTPTLTAVETGNITVPVYTNEITVSPADSGNIRSVSTNFGLNGDKYSATCVPVSGYQFVKWSDNETSATNSNLNFGTSYTATLSAVPATDASVDKTTIYGGVDTIVTVSLVPSTADKTPLSLSVGAQHNCYVDYEPTAEPNQIKLTNVSGNGNFILYIRYGTDWVKEVPMRVSTGIDSVTIVGSPSMKVGEHENYDVVVVPAAAAGSTINWFISNSAVTSYELEDDGTVTLTGLKLGYTNLTATVGGVSQTVRIDVVDDEDVTDVTITSAPDEVVVGKTGTLKATVTLSSGKDAYGVAWSVDDPTKAKIESTGKDKLTGTLTGKSEGLVTVRATSVADPSVFDECNVYIVGRIETNDLIYKSEDGGTIKLTKLSGNTGYTLDLNWGKGVTGDPTTASVKSVTYTLSAGDTKAVSLKEKGKVTPLKSGETVTIQPTVTYTDEYEDSTFDTVDVKIIDDWATDVKEYNSSSSSSTSSDYYIGFKFNNDEVYTGYDTGKNLTDITGYRVEVLRDGNVVAGKTFTKSMSVGSTYKVEKSDLNDLLAEASGDLSGDSPTIKFRISPYGTNQKGNSAYNTDAGKTIERTVYKDGNRYYLDKNGNSSSSSSKGSSSLINGGSGNAGANLDKVPKTGEGNTRLLILMVAIISATVAGSILLSTLPAKKKSGVDEGVDDKDIFHKKD